MCSSVNLNTGSDSVATTTVGTQNSSTPSKTNPCTPPLWSQALPVPNPGSHGSILSHCSFVFLRLSSDWHHTVCNLLKLLLSACCLWDVARSLQVHQQLWISLLLCSVPWGRCPHVVQPFTCGRRVQLSLGFTAYKSSCYKFLFPLRWIPTIAIIRGCGKCAIMAHCFPTWLCPFAFPPAMEERSYHGILTNVHVCQRARMF